MANTKMTDSASVVSKGRIPLKEILHASQDPANVPLGLVDTYRQKVLTQKTRTIRLLGRKSSAKIIHTLLGYEVKASNKRIHCPDLVTARYLKIFAELGCHSIKLPYDPTITALLIADLEGAMQEIIKAIRRLFSRDFKRQQYVSRGIYRIVRRQIRAAQKTHSASLPLNEFSPE